MEGFLFFAGSFFVEGGLVLILMRLLTWGSSAGTGEHDTVADVPERKAA